MAWHDIAFACGHVERVQLYGPGRQRERRAEWLAEGSCDRCWREELEQARNEENERSAEANRAAGLPALEGSAKQTPWAETIRAGLLSELERKRQLLTEALVRQASEGGETGPTRKLLAGVETAHAALLEVTAAKWFIDHRSASPRTLARMAACGQLRPRTEQDRATGFAPGGLNRMTFPAEDVAGRTKNGERVLLRLTHSRWEGCWAVHPAWLTKDEPDGSVTISFAGDDTVRISDGARTRRVPAADFHLDRARRRAEPGERHYWDPLPYREDQWNEIDIPEGEVSDHQDSSKDLVVVRLACSRWEGLHFHHPAGMVRRHRPGFVTVRFGPGWDFTLRGGARPLRIDGRQMHQDRTTPLPQPGESLAVEPKTWHPVTFHPSRLRRAKDAWMVRLPHSTPWPEATVFHPDRMCRVHEDEQVTWRFHEDWTFRVRTPAAGTVDLDVTQFLAVTSDWAGRPPAPGTYVHHPDHLAPAAEITIPAELLEDDPDVGDD